MGLAKKIFGFLGVVLLLGFGIGLLLPGQVHVERQIVINAPPEQIFAAISDLNQWQDWSPWAKLDPNAQMQVSGAGLGQKMVWKSDNPDVGNGAQVITELDRPFHLKTHLEFDGQGLADASFDLIAADSGTQVVWSLDSNVREEVPWLFQPMSGYAGLLLDPLVGSDYEMGLQNLKATIEGNTAG